MTSTDTETVMDVTKSRQMAEIKIVHYASAIKALEAAEFLGVKIREFNEGYEKFWQIVLVDRRDK